MDTIIKKGINRTSLIHFFNSKLLAKVIFVRLRLIMHFTGVFMLERNRPQTDTGPLILNLILWPRGKNGVDTIPFKNRLNIDQAYLFEPPSAVHIFQANVGNYS